MKSVMIGRVSVMAGMLCFGAAIRLPCQESAPPMRAATQEIRFEGKAKGGTLILGDTPRRISRLVGIDTSPGEPAESIAQRLSEASRGAREFGECCGPLMASGGTIILGGFQHDGRFLLGGTERGLGIPDPPRSLSASYAAAADQLFLYWTNPPHGYDVISVVLDASIGNRKLAGTRTACVLNEVSKNPDIFRIDDLDICVLGYRGTVPSNAAAIHLTGCAQDELINLPFTDNIAPNWRPWQQGPDEGSSVLYDQGEKDLSGFRRLPFGFFTTPEKKPFFQKVKTTAQESRGGVWRQFLGLFPGHTYRVSVRLNTLGVQEEDGDWTCSFHAAHNAPTGQELTGDQMAGLEALPDGSAGADAGRIVEYGPGETTEREWVKSSTGPQAEEGLGIEDITLPEGVSVITVWLRLSGFKPSGVGMDWISLEDLTCSR